MPDAAGVALDCVVAMAFLESEKALLVLQWFIEAPHSAWQRDLLTGTNAGSVVLLDLEGKIHRLLAKGLAFPYGIVRSGNDGVVVSESWRSRLLELPLSGSGPWRTVLGSLPGHPSRIIPRPGGYWLTVFAPRSQLMPVRRGASGDIAPRMMAESAHPSLGGAHPV